MNDWIDADILWVCENGNREAKVRQFLQAWRDLVKFQSFYSLKLKHVSTRRVIFNRWVQPQLLWIFEKERQWHIDENELTHYWSVNWVYCKHFTAVALSLYFSKPAQWIFIAISARCFWSKLLMCAYVSETQTTLWFILWCNRNKHMLHLFFVFLINRMHTACTVSCVIWPNELNAMSCANKTFCLRKNHLFSMLVLNQSEKLTEQTLTRHNLQYDDAN